MQAAPLTHIFAIVKKPPDRRSQEEVHAAEHPHLAHRVAPAGEVGLSKLGRVLGAAVRRPRLEL